MDGEADLILRLPDDLGADAGGIGDTLGGAGRIGERESALKKGSVARCVPCC